MMMSFKAFWNRLGKAFIGLCALALYLGAVPVVHGAAAEPYRWDNVDIGGGGYVVGMAIHPTEPDLVYIRTDIGGVLRWDPVQDEWIQLFDSFPEEDWNMYGVDAIALDPSDPDLVYAAVGKYTWASGDILKSADRGETWARTGFLPDINSNGAGRDLGERLAVDPNDGDILYMATRSDGLWTSVSAASPGSWVQVNSFPSVGSSGVGLPFVAFDPDTGTAGNPTQTIYVGARGEGVYRSLDGGATWGLMTGSPPDPNRAAVASDGTLYVSHNAGVMKYKNGIWTDISPTPGETKKYVGITVHPSNPNIVMSAIMGFGDPIYRSTDGGATWSAVSFQKHQDVPWWRDEWWAGSLSSLAIDPAQPSRIWYTDFFGTWRTDDIMANPSQWYTHERGHEEVVAFALRSAPVGAPLFSGVADASGMRHASLTQFPDEQFNDPLFGDNTSIDFQETNPDYVVRVGITRYEADVGGGAYSTDNGVTWTAFPAQVGKAGRIAVSADSERMVWIPQNGQAYYSTDRGSSWTASQGVPGNLVHDFWTWYQPLASDRVDGSKFYVFDRLTGKFYRSTDGGASFAYVSDLPVPGNNEFRIVTAPGMEGEVWAAFDGQGLYRSSDAGGTWTKLGNVQRALLAAFGKNWSGFANPTVFVYGTVDHMEGIFRSDDLGANWVQIDLPEPTVGNQPNTMEGDRQQWGRVYVGTNGSGVYYGESLISEEPDDEPPTAPANLASTARTAATVKLSWTASTDNVGVAGYEIYSGTEFVGTTTVPSQTTFTVTNLTPSTTYTFTVKAKDGAGNRSAASNAVTVSTLAEPPAPTNLTLSSAARGSLNVSWTPPSDPSQVAAYRVYVGTKQVGTTPGTAYTVTGLLPGTTYAITVRSADEAGSTSAPSNALTAQTLASPGTLAYADDFEDGAADGWTPTIGSWSVVTADGSKVYRQSQYTTSMAYSTIDGSSYDDYSVEARIKMTSTDPDPAAGVVARYTDSGNLYSFRYRAGKLHIVKYVDGGYTLLAEKSYPMNVNQAYTFTAVLNGEELALYVDGIRELTVRDATHTIGKAGLFTYKVKMDADQVKIIRDNDFVAPGMPTNVAAANVSATTVELTWTPPADPDVAGYDVYNGEALAGTAAQPAFTVSGLTPGTAYTFTVRAKDAAGNASEASGPLTVTTEVSHADADHAAAAITVDGQLDEAAWSTPYSIAKAIEGSNHHEARFGVLWDAANLYVGVSVTDPQPVNDSAEVYFDDSVEVYIDGNHNRGTAYDGYDRQYIKGWNDGSLFEKNGLTSGVQHAWAAAAGGYTVELAIPWSSLGITPAAGMTIGFDAAVNNDDDGGGRDGQLMWAGTGDNWQDTSAFGELQLAAPSPDTPVEIVVDNTAAEIIGTFTASTTQPGYYGTNYLYGESGGGSYKARWRPDLPTAGNYEVYYWLPDGSPNRATNAPFTVYDGGGSTKYLVNQQGPGGQWVLLGTHAFNAGTSGYVELTNSANNFFVIADAIKFVKAD